MAAPASWLAQLANQIAAEFYAVDVLAPLGCHYYFNKSRNQWEVTLFASKTETVGGEFDGKISSSKFNLDLKILSEMFSEVTRFHWQALAIGPDDELGPHLSLEGIYQGRSVWLRIPATAPSRFTSGRCFNAYEFRLTDNW